jgi:hypothetical protein
MAIKLRADGLQAVQLLNDAKLETDGNSKVGHMQRRQAF